MAMTWWQILLSPFVAALGGLLGFAVVEGCIMIHELWISRKW